MSEKKINLVIDASNIKVGGGVQVALSFIDYLLHNSDSFNISYIVSSSVYEQIKNKEIIDKYWVINTGIYTLNPLSKSRREIRNILSKEKNSIVFTIFGPNFWGKHEHHVVGFANAWVVSPDTIAYKKFGFFKRLLVRLKNIILGCLLYDYKRHYITETSDVRERFITKFKANPKKITVIPNALPYMYSSDLVMETTSQMTSYSGYFKFLTIAANYPHKNLQVIENVGRVLENCGSKFVFFVTIPEDEYSKFSEGFKKYTHNLGVIPVEKCPEYYSSADAFFLPTLLECFTVSYLEAMFCSIPILTSDFDFSREVCKDSAIYFDPESPIDIAEKLLEVINDESLRVDLVKKGKCQLLNHLTNEERSKRYLDVLKKIGMNNV
ncbi:glycosyltransferase [Vibrio parahaemolyticus]|uniref:glycosyltransferase n=1 Tax=Vibrio parahaemolyticus TaxID=670 RepID=UPI000402D72B|nr:glycosyltransferase [Vibrio parahaemolyticus]ELB2133738.1 glycosyltransferase [Vibrio parahaemolyticus]MCQ9046646.1 glycosyltransferase [Vibrio parahaemolyticus]HCG5486687.1 glycosyltransferase [Vibrio parahaemolyticus]